MIEQLRDKILGTWLKAIRQVNADITIIFTRESGPRPVKPYLSLDLISGPNTLGGYDDMRRDTATQNRFVISSMRQYTLNIQAFGAEGLSILDEVQTLMEGPDFGPALRNDDVDLAVVERGGVDDISELLETGYEARSSMDIIFNAAINVTVDPGTIDTVQFEGTIENGEDVVVSGTVPEP